MVDPATGRPAAGVAELLRRSLAHLAAEVPESHRRLVAELGPQVIEVATDAGDRPGRGTGTETFTVRAEGPRIVVRDGPSGARGTRIDTTRATILDVVDAVVGLAEAVESGRLNVCGTVEDVLRAHDALLAYAHAAVRAPSAPGLLAALRAGVGERR